MFWTRERYFRYIDDCRAEIMIHRRVIEQLREQQWLSVGIELVIVVLGVFIGLQASNWNQERASARQGAIFAERLKADLRHEDWVYQFLIDYNRQVLKNADQAVSALEGKTTLSDEALLVSAYRATQYKQPLRRRSTYDELISTGTARVSTTLTSVLACPRLRER